jgi:hypothetical protein
VGLGAGRGREAVPAWSPASLVRGRQNLPQRRRNTYFIFGSQNALKPYNGNDGCPPGRRDLTAIRCAPTESASHLARAVYLLRPGAAGPTWAAMTDPQSSRPIPLSRAGRRGEPPQAPAVTA